LLLLPLPLVTVVVSLLVVLLPLVLSATFVVSRSLTVSSLTLVRVGVFELDMREDRFPRLACL